MTEQQTIRAVPTPAPEPEPPSDLDDPKLYDNRELSWLTFNERVLELSEDDQPLLERLKFSAIFTSNLDEFFMIRVAGLHDQVDAGLANPGAEAVALEPRPEVEEAVEQQLAPRLEVDRHRLEAAPCARARGAGRGQGRRATATGSRCTGTAARRRPRAA